MTFPEFVARRLLGPPVHMAGKEARWDCVFCGKEAKLHIYEAHDKPRLKCWSCWEGDDLPGMWQLKNPGNYFRHAQEAIDAWRQEWEKAGEAARKTAAVQPLLSRGKGGGSGPCQVDPAEVGAAWCDLSEGQRDLLIEALMSWRQITADIGPMRPGVTFEALAEYCLDFRRWERGDFHRPICDDLDCKAPACQSALGERRFRHFQSCRDSECTISVCTAYRDEQEARQQHKRLRDLATNQREEISHASE